ncbi:hypothetical protein AAF712_005521 [Marasmius tenuissimus]|uniref:Uncharacterized protein n=1 Tax=Marasmius tenuissimus TaxID=585030 RepID=A0ABR3A0Q6_9AGAR
MVDILILTVSKEEYENARERGQYLLWTQEMHEIFLTLAPHTWRFRSFHLQVHDGHCKAVARHYIGTKDGKIFGPAPNLETWQLYHFENFRNVGDLHEATRRQPVTCFADNIPKLKNLSLIGVNLPWNSPYLKDLQNLELSLHTNSIRPEYEHWSNMLSRSPELRTLFLHYSGPQSPAESQWPVAVITLPKLEKLGLVDLEPEYLQQITSRLDTPNVKKLEIELRDEEDETVVYDDWLRCISANGSHKFQSLVSLKITELQCGDFDTSLRMFLGTLNQLRELEMKDEVWSSVWRMFVVDLEWDGEHDGRWRYRRWRADIVLASSFLPFIATRARRLVQPEDDEDVGVEEDMEDIDDDELEAYDDDEPVEYSEEEEEEEE